MKSFKRLLIENDEYRPPDEYVHDFTGGTSSHRDPEENHRLLSSVMKSVPFGRSPRTYHSVLQKRETHPQSYDFHQRKLYEPIHELIRKGPYVPRDTMVFRGLFNDKKPEGQLGHFTPTSLDHRVAENFAKLRKDGDSVDVLSIHVPAKSRALYMNTSDRKAHFNEKELILHPKAVLDIHPEPTIVPHTTTYVVHDKDGVRNEVLTGTKRVWHARLVHDGVSK